MDLVYLGAIVLLLAAAYGFAAGCEHLRGRK